MAEPERRTGSVVSIEQARSRPPTPAVGLRAKWLLHRHIADDLEAPDLAVRLALHLLDMFSWETGNCYPSLGYLARKVGRSETQTRTALKWLLARRYFEREERGQQRSPVYWPNWSVIDVVCPADSLRSAARSEVRKTAPLEPPRPAEIRTPGVRKTEDQGSGIPHPIPDSPESSKADSIIGGGSINRKGSGPSSDPADELFERLVKGGRCGRNVWRPILDQWIKNHGLEATEAAIDEAIGLGLKNDALSSHVAGLLRRTAQAGTRRTAATATDLDDESWRTQFAIRCDDLRSLTPHGTDRAQVIRELVEAFRRSRHPAPRNATLRRLSELQKRYHEENLTREQFLAALGSTPEHAQ